MVLTPNTQTHLAQQGLKVTDLEMHGRARKCQSVSQSEKTGGQESEVSTEIDSFTSINPFTLGTAGTFLLIRPTTGKSNTTYRNAVEGNKVPRKPNRVSSLFLL